MGKVKLGLLGLNKIHNRFFLFVGAMNGFLIYWGRIRIEWRGLFDWGFEVGDYNFMLSNVFEVIGAVVAHSNKCLDKLNIFYLSSRSAAELSY